MKFEELHNDKETNDECLLNTVKESLNKGELCLFMSETGTFMTTGKMMIQKKHSESYYQFY